jgi:hypothetical protein
MGTSWEWLDDTKRIAVVSSPGNWNRSELDAYTHDFWPQMEQQPHIVDVIVDLRGPGILPMQPVAHLIWLGQHRPVNAGRVVFVVRRTMGLALVRALNRTIQRLYPRFELSAVLTKEEAIRLLSISRAGNATSLLAQAGSQSPTEFPR